MSQCNIVVKPEPNSYAEMLAAMGPTEKRMYFTGYSLISCDLCGLDVGYVTGDRPVLLTAVCKECADKP